MPTRPFFTYKKPTMLPPREEGKGLPTLFWEAAEKWGDQPAFAQRCCNGEFELITYQQWRQRALFLATGLINLGVKHQQPIGLFSDNCFEWMLAETALQFCGAITVPRGADITAEEMRYIITHAGLRIILLQNRKLLPTLEKILADLPHPPHILIMQGEEEQALPATISLIRLEKYGEKLWIVGDRSVEKARKRIALEDLYTIIYTSGTTGNPKGVELSHRSIMQQVKLLSFLLHPQERTLSILPLWHSYERVFEVLTLAAGGCTYYTSLRHLAKDLVTVRPTMMASAPRLWESLYQRIISKLHQASCWQNALFKGALRVGSAFHRLAAQQRQAGDKKLLSITLQQFFLFPLFFLADQSILKRVRTILGGALRGTISGGGALPDHIDRFFQAIGIPIFEGYGLTESGPVVAVRLPERFLIGTVGPLLPETEVQIRDLENGEILYPNDSLAQKGKEKRGEICLRGAQLMRGYRAQPQETAATLQEGWLRTGDIGLMTETGCLKIVGRCKETIVLLNGENVEPVPIETRLQSSALIEQCVIVGQDQKQLGALILPSLEGFQQKHPDLFKKRRDSFSTKREEILEYQEKLTPLLDHEIRTLIHSNHGFKPFERIGIWSFLERPFEVGKELTPTYKLRRHQIATLYQEQIKKMFTKES